ncbi:uncharacterized protein V2V93DRAFT_319859 [Kockiozyma suomiensis]|uniref:uncharacterized protein n=1 Tax=Kockiozyma suomiensis TaxID=1337062 RepID=UPI0033439C1D
MLSISTPVLTSPGEDMPRRAVVFSRLGGGALKPQTRSFMRITRELADEFAPADAEIKHEAEITMAFREDLTTDDDDEDDDDEDDYDEDYDDGDYGDDEDPYYDSDSRGIRRTQQQRMRFDAKYGSAYPGITPPFSVSGSGSSSSGLLESPPFRRRRRRRRRRRHVSPSTREHEEDTMHDFSSVATTPTLANAPSSSTSPSRAAALHAAISTPLASHMYSPASTASPITPVPADRKLKRRGPVEETIEAHSIKRRAVSPAASTAAITIPTSGSAAGTMAPGASSPTLSNVLSSSPGASLVAGKRSMKQMQETYDRIQKMSLG